MNKVIVAVAAAMIALSSSQVKSEPFMNGKGHGWEVYGDTGYPDKGLHPSCTLFYSKIPNVDFFAMTQDFADGELYFVIKNPEWDLTVGKKVSGSIIIDTEKDLFTFRVNEIEVAEPDKIFVRNLDREWISQNLAGVKSIIINPDPGLNLSEQRKFTNPIIARNLMSSCAKGYLEILLEKEKDKGI